MSVTHLALRLSAASSLEVIDHARRSIAGFLVPPLSDLWYAAKPVVPHQTGHAVLAAGLAFVAQLFPHAGAAKGLVALLVEIPDAAQEPLVVPSPGARRTLAPCVVAARRNAQAATHETDGKLVAATIHEAISHLDPLAKNVAASRKKSLSCFTRASSRLRAVTSSSLA